MMASPRTVCQQRLFNIIAPEYFTPKGKPNTQENVDTLYRVPLHQRFPTWPLTKKQKLVDSVLRNFPIHAIIVIEQYDEHGKYFNVEDGQTRMTALQEYLLDGFACESGPNSAGNGRKFSELPPHLQDTYKNYFITVESFCSTRNCPITSEDIAEIFTRLNSGKPLGDNDKYYSRMQSPVLRRVNDITSHPELRADVNRFIGKVGAGKTRKGLSDMVGAILAIATRHGERGGKSCINTSYELNHPFIGMTITDEQFEENIVHFFKLYFAMLHNATGTITQKPRKVYGKLSGLLGLSICSFIDSDAIHPAIEWYANQLTRDRNYEPPSFRLLTKGDRRNCQGDAISRRLHKIIAQWEWAQTADPLSAASEILLADGTNYQVSELGEDEDTDDDISTSTD